MEDEIKISKDLLRTVSADTRVDILKLLETRPMTASEISRMLGKHVTTVTEHLDLMKRNELIERVERPGRKWVYYRLTKRAGRILHPTSYYRLALALSLVVVVLTASAFTLYLQKTVPIKDTNVLVDQANLILEQQLEQSVAQISNQDISNTLNSPN